MVARTAGGREVASSNLAAPTDKADRITGCHVDGGDPVRFCCDIPSGIPDREGRLRKVCCVSVLIAFFKEDRPVYPDGLLFIMACSLRRLMPAYESEEAAEDAADSTVSAAEESEDAALMDVMCGLAPSYQ